MVKETTTTLVVPPGKLSLGPSLITRQNSQTIWLCYHSIIKLLSNMRSTSFEWLQCWGCLDSTYFSINFSACKKMLMCLQKMQSKKFSWLLCAEGVALIIQLILCLNIYHVTSYFLIISTEVEYVHACTYAFIALNFNEI